MLKKIADNALIACNIFILFLLVFYQHLHIPAWLQVAGRMHPLLLHFPIVLIILAVSLDFMKFRDRSLLNGLWLVGCLSAALSVIMGIILSREEGYGGDMLAWHKWAGVAVLWIATALYWYRSTKVKAETLSVNKLLKPGGALLLIAIAVTGHFGANLTHGDDFLLAPVTPKPKGVPIAQAAVFDHLVKPILEQKCYSCHNSAKAKGELLMQTTEQLLKGGKTGPLFIAGNPAASLMMERLHLPLDAKEHMPPKNKTQLTDEEIDILQQWISHGADFKLMVSALPREDTLYQLAAQFLGGSSEEDYTFAAASESTLKKLNNNYRVIYPIARNSPALVANFYNKDQYNKKALEELLPLKDQLVELHLQKMPVKDEDLAVIKQFTQLRRINLDFTSIKGDGLKELAALPHLQSLALSGTAISLPHLQPLMQNKTLREVYCWSTSLTNGEWDQLDKQKRIRFERGYNASASEPLKLNAPIIENEQTIFLNQQTLSLRHPIKGTEIRYTLDGTEPDSVNSQVYMDSLRIDSSFTVKARAYKAGWYGSEVVKARFLKTTYQPDDAVLLKPANEKYTGEGAKTFLDHQTGNFDFGNGKWLGFRYNDMELLLLFKKPVNVSEVTVSTLQRKDSYIFPPQRLEIWGGANPDKLTLLKTIHPVMPGKDTPPAYNPLECKFSGKEVSCLKVVAVPVPKLPSWHEGKGKKAWVFVDEVLIN
ncbi:c-type cytochrome domain-containing protein [Chitinophaga barathri]|uniref:Cytochrome C n=1 Tax=Chitinophaga barathri TaxID=1647451 RepID=A0A3N4MMC4_9BACT|nr:c-type cytochrome domain-containing protein [Chitinophaga barathri]RPD43167.1 cytochrome C [Chitinophaga barathri]